jgi:hypothetical protein
MHPIDGSASQGRPVRVRHRRLAVAACLPVRHDGRMLVVDAANVVGSRPTGWWRDRPGAAAGLWRDLVAAASAGRLQPPMVVVLEGAARHGVAEGEDAGVRIVHAAGSGDDTIVTLVEQAVAQAQSVTVVTADRGLRERVRGAGAEVVGPQWLLTNLE